MTKRLFAGLALATMALPLGMGACSSDTRSSIETDVRSAVTAVGDAAGDVANNAAEAVARNVATQQGEEQFKNAGHELDGPLTCDAQVADGLSAITIDCTGTTQAGGAATLTGTTSELPGASVVTLDGQFVGMVDGAEVFSTARLGG